jgi:hypothetical protein
MMVQQVTGEALVVGGGVMTGYGKDLRHMHVFRRAKLTP